MLPPHSHFLNLIPLWEHWREQPSLVHTLNTTGLFGICLLFPSAFTCAQVGGRRGISISCSNLYFLDPRARESIIKTQLLSFCVGLVFVEFKTSEWHTLCPRRSQQLTCLLSFWSLPSSYCTGASSLAQSQIYWSSCDYFMGKKEELML